jgi:hypothetical protein
VPTPVRFTVDTQVADDFQDMAVGGRVRDWNIRDAGWCPVRVVEVAGNRRLRLADRDPYDYAKAFRVFPEMAKPRVALTLIPAQHTHGSCEVELVNRTGLRPVVLKFDSDGKLKRRHAGGWTDFGTYQANIAYRLVIDLDLPQTRWSATLNGAAVATNVPLYQAVPTVERLELRTGAWRLDDWTRVKGYNDYPKDMLPGADDPVSEAVFDVDDVSTTTADTTPPATPTAPTASLSGSNVMLSGMSEPGATISIRNHGVQIATTTADGNGRWSITVTLPAGEHQLSVVAADAAGNASTTSPTTTITVPVSGGGTPPASSSSGGGSSTCGLGAGMATLLLLGVLGLLGHLRAVRCDAAGAPLPCSRTLGA